MSHTRSITAIIAASILISSFAALPARPAAAQASSGFFAKVEVRGQFLPAPKAGDVGQPMPMISAGELVFEVSMTPTHPSAKELEKLYHRVVLARGNLNKRTDAMGKEHLVLKPEGRIEAVGKVSYLVGYHENELKALEDLCKELGLKIIENYRPGKYLNVEPTGQTKHDFEAHLRKNEKAVRYVEANVQYHAQPGGAAPK